MNIKKFILAGLVLAASLVASAEDVEACKYGGTNDPYTVENPLNCDKFTYIGAGTGAAGTRPDSLASFLSGTHTIAGQFLSSGLCTKYSKNADLVISGSDTVVTANDVLIQNIRNTDGFNCTVDGIPFRTRFFIKDGATLKAENGFKMEPSNWYKPLVSIDGGTLEIAQGDFNLYSSASTGYVHSANGATVKVPNGNLVLGDVEMLQAGQYLASVPELLQSGKHPGKTNVTDTDNALNILRYLMDRPCAVIVKHNNPCGVAVGATQLESYLKARDVDPVSAYGSVVAMNSPVGKDVADEICSTFVEVLIAPSFTEEAREIMKKKERENTAYYSFHHITALFFYSIWKKRRKKNRNKTG